MPHRTGLSHAVFAVFLSALWVLFNNTLAAVVREEHFAALVEFVATVIHRQTGLSLAYSTVATLVTIALLTVLGFTWGYTFHLHHFGREN